MPYTIPEWAKSPPDATTPHLSRSYSKATGKDLTPVPGMFDKESGSAMFAGHHGNYAVTLAGCPCGSNPKPCKHMYRLAMELGIMSGELSSSPIEAQNRYDANESDQVSLRDAIAALENLNEPAQLFLKDALGMVSNIEVSSVRVRLPETANDALTFPYLSFSPVPAAEIMDAMRKKDIAAILDRLNVHPESNLKKADLIPWCVQNIPALSDELPKEYYTACLPCFRKEIKKVYTYLRRKFEFSYEFGCDVPFGAIPDDLNIHVSADGAVQSGAPFGYRFPVDEITELLTLYGHNRCLNGYVPPEEAAGQFRQDHTKVQTDKEDLHRQIAELQASLLSQNKEIKALAERLNTFQPAPQFQEFTAEPQDKTAILIDKLSAFPNVTATIRGAKTAAPVVWLSGDTEAHKAEIEALGGKWSGKRNAWYFKIDIKKEDAVNDQ